MGSDELRKEAANTLFSTKHGLDYWASGRDMSGMIFLGRHGRRFQRIIDEEFHKAIESTGSGTPTAGQDPTHRSVHRDVSVGLVLLTGVSVGAMAYRAITRGRRRTK